MVRQAAQTAEDRAEIGVIEDSGEACLGQAGPGGGFLSEEIEGDVAEDSDVQWGVVGADAGAALVEDDIKHPMESVFDAPLVADRLSEDRRIRRETGEGVAILVAVSPGPVHSAGAATTPWMPP